MVLPFHTSKIVFPSLEYMIVILKLFFQDDWSITIPNKSETQNNASHMSEKVMKDHSRTRHVLTHPYLKKNPKGQSAVAERGRIHDVDQSSATLFGTIPSAPSFGTVLSTPPFGTVPSAEPSGTVTPTTPIGTISSASPLETVPPNGFISNFLHYNQIMQNFGNNGPVTNILSTFQVPPATPLSFSSSDLPTTSNTHLQETPMVNLMDGNPEMLEQINELLTKSILEYQKTL
ncbi:hypothetical protein CRE_30450 [Caenorhabditis remanei]|uniref:Uncharacterized protein n=1 Tax=Caenorhabditis remanei TaxID=31234 RepID=E3NDZ9_CAERE|nr:hypothetical protein CRE_30450 [Caenorhabditis remanei]